MKYFLALFLCINVLVLDCFGGIVGGQGSLDAGLRISSDGLGGVSVIEPVMPDNSGISLNTLMELREVSDEIGGSVIQVDTRGWGGLLGGVVSWFQGLINYEPLFGGVQKKVVLSLEGSRVDLKNVRVEGVGEAVELYIFAPEGVRLEDVVFEGFTKVSIETSEVIVGADGVQTYYPVRGSIQTKGEVSSGSELRLRGEYISVEGKVGREGQKLGVFASGKDQYLEGGIRYLRGIQVGIDGQLIGSEVEVEGKDGGYLWTATEGRAVVRATGGDVRLKFGGYLEFLYGQNVVSEVGSIEVECQRLGGMPNFMAGMDMNIVGEGSGEAASLNAGGRVSVLMGEQLKVIYVNGREVVLGADRLQVDRLEFVDAAWLYVHGFEIKQIKGYGKVFIKKYCGEVADPVSLECEGKLLNVNGTEVGTVIGEVELQLEGDNVVWVAKGSPFKSAFLGVVGDCNVTQGGRLEVVDELGMLCRRSLLNQGYIKAGGVFWGVAPNITNEGMYENDPLPKEVQNRRIHFRDQGAWIWNYEKYINNTGVIEGGMIRMVATQGDVENKRGGVIRSTNKGGNNEILAKGNITNICAKVYTEDGLDKKKIPNIREHFEPYRPFKLNPSELNIFGSLFLQTEVGDISNIGSNIFVNGNLTYNSANDIKNVEVRDKFYLHGVDWEKKHWKSREIHRDIDAEVVQSALEVVNGVKTRVAGRDIQDIGAYAINYGGMRDEAERDIVGKTSVVTRANAAAGHRTHEDGYRALYKMMGREWDSNSKEALMVTGGVGEGPKGFSGGVAHSLNGDIEQVAKGDVLHEGMSMLGKTVTVSARNYLPMARLDKYIAREERGKRHHIKIEAGMGMPTTLRASEGDIVIDVEGKAHVQGTLLWAEGKILLNGEEVDGIPASVQLEHMYWKESKKFLSSSSVTQFINELYVMPTVFIAKGGGMIQARKRVNLEGVSLVLGEEATMDIIAPDVKASAYEALRRIETHRKSSGLALPGLTGAIVDAIDGKSFGGSLKGKIPLINALRQIGSMQSATDLAPVMNAGMEVYQVAENYAKSFEVTGGNHLAALSDVTMAQLGFSKVGGMVIPSGIGWYNMEEEVVEAFYDIYEMKVNGGTVRIFADRAELEGMTVDLKKNLYLKVTDSLKLLALETAVYSEERRQSHQFSIGFGEGYVSFSFNRGEGEETMEGSQVIPGSVKVGGDFIAEVGGNAHFQTPVRAKNIHLNVAKNLTIETAQSKEQVDSSSVGWGFGLSWGRERGLTPSLQAQASEGKGERQWATVQNEMVAEEKLTIEADHLSLKGAVLDAPEGEIKARSFDYEDVINQEHYETQSWGFSTQFLSPLLAGAKSGVAQVGSAILGTLQWGLYGNEAAEILRATVAPGITIETQSDLEGLNRDLAKRRELLYEKKAAYSLAMPIVDFQKLKENVALIGEAIEDAKGQFKAYFTKAREGLEKEPEALEQLTNLEEGVQAGLEGVASENAGSEAQRLRLELLTRLAKNADYQDYVQLQKTAAGVLKGKSWEEASAADLAEIAVRAHTRVQMQEQEITVEVGQKFVAGEIVPKAYYLGPDPFEARVQALRAYVEGLPSAQQRTIAQEIRQHFEWEVFRLEGNLLEEVGAFWQQHKDFIKGTANLGLSMLPLWDASKAYNEALTGFNSEGQPLEPMERLCATLQGTMDLAIDNLNVVMFGIAKPVVKGGGKLIGSALEVAEEGLEMAIKKGGKLIERIAARGEMLTAEELVKHIGKPSWDSEFVKILKRMEKGGLGEAAPLRVFERLGYNKLASKLPGNKGFDGVFVKYGAKGEVVDIVIVESKFAMDGKARLSKLADETIQMSKKWIETNIDNMIAKGDDTVQKVGKLLQENKAKIRLKINVLDGNGVNHWNVLQPPVD